MKKENKYLIETLNKNEAKTNIINSMSFILMSILNISYIIHVDYSKEVNGEMIKLFLVITQLVLIMPSIICFIFKGKKAWIKYLIVFAFVLSSSCAILFCESGIYIIIMLIPVIASCLYYSPKFTTFVSIFSLLMLLLFSVINIFYLPILYPDINFVILEEGFSTNVSGYVYYSLVGAPIDRLAYFGELFKFLLLPLTLLYVIIIIICASITKRARVLISDQADTMEEKIKTNSELELAASIQKNMLPNKGISNDLFEVNSFIKPAKLVGGDFYDYFTLNESKIALIMADVSDKGVPASIFMARCKTLISSLLLAGNSIVDAINYANEELCLNNTSGMFVTAFICIANVNTGEIEFVNAGHCAPLIYKDGKYEILKTNPDLFLGSISGINYSSNKIMLNKGDRLVLYTDGITEAFNEKDEIYGKDRLLSFLNNNIELNGNDIISKLINNVETFAGNNEQSDDMTLLVFTKKGE